jgi:hypothetical protein
MPLTLATLIALATPFLATLLFAILSSSLGDPEQLADLAALPPAQARRAERDQYACLRVYSVYDLIFIPACRWREVWRGHCPIPDSDTHAFSRSHAHRAASRASIHALRACVKVVPVHVAGCARVSIAIQKLVGL